MLGSRNSLPELFVDGYGVLNSVDKRGRCPRRWFATVMFFSFLKKVIKVALTYTDKFPNADAPQVPPAAWYAKKKQCIF